MGNASLIEFRKSLNLKQNEIAKEIGVSPSYYYKVESGYQNPSYEFLAKFKRRFPDASIDVLFFQWIWVNSLVLLMQRLI